MELDYNRVTMPFFLTSLWMKLSLHGQYTKWIKGTTLPEES